MVLASGVLTTASKSTSQKWAIFPLKPSSIGSWDLHTITSGLIPTLLNSLVECWVGFVLNSPAASR